MHSEIGFFHSDVRLHYPVPFAGSADLLMLSWFANGTSMSFAKGVVGHLWLASAATRRAYPRDGAYRGNNKERSMIAVAGGIRPTIAKPPNGAFPRWRGVATKLTKVNVNRHACSMRCDRADYRTLFRGASG
jgi:hypothetical protein